MRGIVLGCVFVIRLAGVATAGEPPAPSHQFEFGRSAAETSCEPGTEVCGIMGPDRLVPFDDACAARAAGASRVLVGPCFDDD